MISEYSGVKPLLLLDDIFDKLDVHRITRLMELVSNETFGQIFITDTTDTHIREVFEKINNVLQVKQRYGLYSVSTKREGWSESTFLGKTDDL